MGGLRWMRRSPAKLAAQLTREGLAVGASTMHRLLQQHLFSLRVNRKFLANARHPDRDPQFQRIAALRCQCAAVAVPLISVDTKKKELVGLFKQAGRTCVGIQIVSCDSALIGPDTGRVRFSRTFVGEPGSPASLRHLSRCLGCTSGIDAEAGLARIISFRQEPPSGPV